MLCRQEEACKVCDQHDAVAVVCKTMTGHTKEPAVQQQACAALINLCVGESFERREHAAQSGVLGAIVGAMRNQIEHPAPGIQEMAFVAIQNICFGGDANGAARKQRAIDAGAFEAIVVAIRRFQGTTSVHDQDTATLRLLCNNDQLLKARAMEAGAKKDWLQSHGGISRLLGR